MFDIHCHLTMPFAKLTSREPIDKGLSHIASFSSMPDMFVLLTYLFLTFFYLVGEKSKE